MGLQQRFTTNGVSPDHLGEEKKRTDMTVGNRSYSPTFSTIIIILIRSDLLTLEQANHNKKLTFWHHDDAVIKTNLQIMWDVKYISLSSISIGTKEPKHKNS